MHLANTNLSNKYLPQNLKKYSSERSIPYNKIEALPVQTTLSTRPGFRAEPQ